MKNVRRSKTHPTEVVKLWSSDIALLLNENWNEAKQVTNSKTPPVTWIASAFRSNGVDKGWGKRLARHSNEGLEIRNIKALLRLGRLTWISQVQRCCVEIGIWVRSKSWEGRKSLLCNAHSLLKTRLSRAACPRFASWRGWPWRSQQNEEHSLPRYHNDVVQLELHFGYRPRLITEWKCLDDLDCFSKYFLSKSFSPLSCYDAGPCSFTSSSEHQHLNAFSLSASHYLNFPE